MKQYAINYLLPTLLSSATQFHSRDNVTHPFILSTYILSASYPIGAFLDSGERALNKMDKNALVGKEKQ